MANKKQLIDAKPLMQNGWHLVQTGESNKFLASMSLADVPIVDAVEVVRCKNCKHLGFKGLCDGVCNRKMIGFVKPDDFCSYGERKK